MGLPSNAQLLSIAFFLIKPPLPVAHTTYLAHTIQIQNEHRITKLLLPMSPVLPLEYQDVKKNLLTSTCKDVWWHHNHLEAGNPRQSKREALSSWWFELPSNSRHQSKPTLTHALYGFLQPHALQTTPTGLSCGCQAQITSVNWPQVPLGGHAEMRNREPCGKFGAIGFGWRTKGQARLLGKKKKIKQNKPSNLHEHVKSFTMSSSPEALLRPVPP